MTQATINIRLDQTLKQHTLKVLDQKGIGISELVRSLFTYIESHQDIPEELKNDFIDTEDEWEMRRNLMNSMIGIIPQDIDCTNIREQRLAKHGL